VLKVEISSFETLVLNPLHIRIDSALCNWSEIDTSILFYTLVLASIEKLKSQSALKIVD